MCCYFVLSEYFALNFLIQHYTKTRETSSPEDFAESGDMALLEHSLEDVDGMQEKRSRKKNALVSLRFFFFF